MLLSEAFKLALQSLWANKMRTILTLLGVVMGVASVIMMITLVNGANTYVATKFSDHGSDIFTVSRMSDVILTIDDYLKQNKRKNISYEDYLAVAGGCKNCSDTGALLETTKGVVYNRKSSTGTQLRGYTWNMLALQNIDLALGRSLIPIDEERAMHVCVVGYDIVDNLMSGEDPIGKEIRADGVPYTIVGVGERQGKTLGQSQDDWVVVPITTYMQTYGSSNQSVVMYLRANTVPGSLERAKDEVRVQMRGRRHDLLGQPESFEIETNDTFLNLWKQISSLFEFVVVGIASIALVVGGIVIMNIMLVSVTERTREIGVRKALGAKRRDVLLQFLIESATMSLLGGMIGVLAGVLVAKGITFVVGFPTTVSAGSVILGLALATSVGVFFGVYPARQAAQLDPIVALRSEM
jgi:putative ABC transport system permease protein